MKNCKCLCMPDYEGHTGAFASTKWNEVGGHTFRRGGIADFARDGLVGAIVCGVAVLLLQIGRVCGLLPVVSRRSRSREKSYRINPGESSGRLSLKQCQHPISSIQFVDIVYCILLRDL
jgi:hypothetical protein